MTCVHGAAFEVAIAAATFVIVRKKEEVVAVVVATEIVVVARINGKNWAEVAVVERVVWSMGTWSRAPKNYYMHNGGHWKGQLLQDILD